VLKTSLKITFLILGVYLLYRTAVYISWTGLLELFQSAGLWVCLPLFVYPVACVFHTLAMKRLFGLETRGKLGFFPLYSVRMSGDALDKMTPFVDIGGEPLKAVLFYERGLAPLAEGITTVWVSRVGFVLSEILFVALGLWLFMITAPSETIFWAVVVGLGISLIYLGILVTGQMKGAIHVVPALLKYFRVKEQDSESAQRLWQEAADRLRGYYRNNPRDFLVALFWQFCGWVFSFFEVFIFFKVLGIEISLVQALIFQALLQVLKTATFFIPGNLGAQEGGLAYLAVQLGFSATDGFALSLMKRFRQWVWILVGLLLWKLDRRKAK